MATGANETCEGCSNGLHDILRPCPTCKRTVAQKADLRGALYGHDAYVDALVFCASPKAAQT